MGYGVLAGSACGPRGDSALPVWRHQPKKMTKLAIGIRADIGAEKAADLCVVSACAKAKKLSASATHLDLKGRLDRVVPRLSPRPPYPRS